MTLKINNPKKFYNLVNESKGDVFLVLDGQNKINLKENATAREMLLLMKPGQDITIHICDAADGTAFVSYMLYSGFEDRGNKAA